VDDEQRIVNFVRRGLEAEGLEVDAAGGGEEGLQLALSRSYDLVILDLVMPTRPTFPRTVLCGCVNIDRQICSASSSRSKRSAVLGKS